MKDFIPYEQALALKELGFDEPCFGYYVDGELRGINLGMEDLGGIEPYYQRFGFHTLSNHDIDNPNKIVVTAPTFSQAFRFFREKYNFKSWVEEHTADTFIYEIRPHILTHYKEGEVYVYTIYEETELACLIKLIEIVKEIFNNK
jgi:hypothetical protein